MEIIWEQGPSTVRDVLNNLLKKKKVAYTTVMTMLDILYKKGHLTRSRRNKAYVYSPKHTKEQFATERVTLTVEELFNQFGEVALNQFAAGIEGLPKDLRDKLISKLAKL